MNQLLPIAAAHFALAPAEAASRPGIASAVRGSDDAATENAFANLLVEGEGAGWRRRWRGAPARARCPATQKVDSEPGVHPGSKTGLCLSPENASRRQGARGAFSVYP